MMKIEGGNVIEIGREVEEVAIPPTATRICEVACFFGSIKSLDLESTNVIIIEKHAFANCYKLEEVRFPSCLEEICEGAFMKCTNLISISIPTDSMLLKIGKNSFKWCLKLEKFDFPRQLEFIGDNSFDGNFKNFDLRETKVRHIVLHYFKDSINVYFPSTVAPGDIIRIYGENFNCHIEVDESHPFVQRDSCGYLFANGTIFQGNKKAKRIIIRRGVERIAKRCFNDSKLVSITIPSSVIKISCYAFFGCRSLRNIQFNMDSQLRVIGKTAFSCCSSIKNIKFPKSLRIIKEGAFDFCCSLERVVFTQGSKLERIEGAFGYTAIKRLSLPPSVKEIIDVCRNMEKLESMFVSSDYYQSNEEGSAIFSKDGSKLVSVIKTLKQFKIPIGVCVIKKRAFYRSSISSRLIIPVSVEVIEEESFYDCCNMSIIEFQEGSRLKSLAFDAFKVLRDLIINNENFVKMENGVVMSMNPRGIVFVPKELTELDIPPGVEVIYSNAFNESKIKSLKFPKSLKKICSNILCCQFLESVTFEEGTELDFNGNHAFDYSNIKSLKLPNIKGELDYYSLDFKDKTLEFPPNLCLRNKELYIDTDNIVCPRTSLPVVAHFDFCCGFHNFVILDSLSQ